MEKWISYRPYRNQEWKGHATKKAVRQAIAYHRSMGRLRIFQWTEDSGYYEIPRSEWAERFTD